MSAHVGWKISLLHSVPAFLARAYMRRRYNHEIAVTGEPELRHLEAIVPSGTTAIDIGCNLGTYTYALSQVGAQVFAFEPNPELANFVERLAWPSVTLQQVAISSINGMAELAIPEMRSGHVLASLDSSVPGKTGAKLNKISVETRRIDDLDFQNVAIIKIDVEGFEEKVLEGAVQTLRNQRPALLIEIEERHNSGSTSRIPNFLQALGYEHFFLVDNFWKSGRDFDPAVHQDYDREYATPSTVKSQICYFNNFLFLHTDGPVQVANGKLVRGKA